MRRLACFSIALLSPALSSWSDVRVFKNEVAYKFKQNKTEIVIHANQISSNKPCEDSLFVRHDPAQQRVVCGVLDGHGGKATAQFAKTAIPYMEQVDLKELDQSIARNVEAIDWDKSSRASRFVKADIECAQNGACALVTEILLKDAVANISLLGDCRAIWNSGATQDQNLKNTVERQGLISSHPDETEEELAQGNYVKGTLQPTRSLGDYNLKWNSSLQEKVLSPFYSRQDIPDKCVSPPYISSTPVITSLVSPPYIVLVTDGYTDLVSDPETRALMEQEWAGNRATQLMQHALENAKKHKNLVTHPLCLFQGRSRAVFDDISVVVIQINSC